MRRALLALVLLVAGCTPLAVAEVPTLAAPASSSTTSTSAAPAPAPPPPPADPCWDFHALEAGKGTPERQAWHNSLRVDGQAPDYVRYWVACQVEGDGGPTWNRAWAGSPLSRDRRWSTKEYECIRGLLDGEHGGKAWDTDHRNGEGINLPQAKPVSKLAGLDVRGQVRWMVDYVNGRYGSPFRTPHPCRAGY